MLLSLQRGADRDEVLKNLREVRSAATDLMSKRASGSAYQWLIAYLEWAGNVVQVLQDQVSAADVDRLIFTRGYERLLSAAGNMTSTYADIQEVLRGLVSLELGQRINAFMKVIEDLNRRIGQWSGNNSYVMADTSVYMQHEHKLRDVDFADHLPGWQDKLVRVLVPVIILDELDGLKRKGDPRQTWRAGYTLAVIDDIFAERHRIPGKLRDPASDRTRGGVLMEILYDPPGHFRLPINDDEIISRTVAAQALAGKPVTFLTFDTSQAMRARSAGLATIKLTTRLGDEPPAKASRTAGAATSGKTGKANPAASGLSSS
jgi:hypothetical protein